MTARPLGVDTQRQRRTIPHMIVFRYLLVLWFALVVPVSAAATAHEHRCDPPAHEISATAEHGEHGHASAADPNKHDCCSNPVTCATFECTGTGSALMAPAAPPYPVARPFTQPFAAKHPDRTDPGHPPDLLRPPA
jgi:hypothetical protein